MKTNLIIMTLMCVYIFKIALLNEFTYYIHPRYITFSIGATLVFFFITMKTWWHMSELHYHEEKRSGTFSFLVVCTLIMAIVLPAKGLTATTAQKRFNSSNQSVVLKKGLKEPKDSLLDTPIVGVVDTEENADVLETGDMDANTETLKTLEFEIAEKASSTQEATQERKQTLTSNTNTNSAPKTTTEKSIPNAKTTQGDTSQAPKVVVPEKKPSPLMVGMSGSTDPGNIFLNFILNVMMGATDLSPFDGVEVELVGFVLIDETDKTSSYHVSRFLITCCIADATPFAVPFEYTGNEYTNDDWVKVNGNLKIITDGGYEKAVVVPTSVERVPEPELPYVYYRM